MGPASLHWCPVTRQGAMGAKWNMGSFIQTWEKTSLLWGWQSTLISWSERLWISWKYSRHTWMLSCVTWCREPALAEVDELDDLQRSFPIPTTLKFLLIFSAFKHHKRNPNLKYIKLTSWIWLNLGNVKIRFNQTILIFVLIFLHCLLCKISLSHGV